MWKFSLLSFFLLLIASVNADTTSPNISFVPPTPENNTTQPFDFIFVNVSSSAVNNHSVFLDWNFSLVGWWAMDWYNVTGIFDNSTYKNFGYFRGNLNHANITSGIYGKALNFDGKNDYLLLGNAPSLNFGNHSSYSIEFWIYKRPPYKNYDQILSKGLAGDQRIHFLIDATGVLYRWSAFPGPTIPLNSWTHIVYVFNSTSSNYGTESFYLNGALTHTRTGTMPSWAFAYDYWLGYHPYLGGSWPFDGLIDEVRFHNRALLPAEINASFNAGLYQLKRNFSNLHPGNYTFRAHALDAMGNYNSTDIRTVFVPCFCNSCADCVIKLNDPACTEVRLITSILNSPTYCLNNPVNFSNKIFDCQGNIIDGTGTGHGIYLDNKWNNIIKNCTITDFHIGIYLPSSLNITISNSSVCRNTGWDIDGNISNFGINNTCSKVRFFRDHGFYLCSKMCPGEDPNYWWFLMILPAIWYFYYFRKRKRP